MIDDTLREKLDNIRQSLFQKSLPPVLYHYTDVSGLQGIIESCQWYATHYLYTNDGREIIYGDDGAGYSMGINPYNLTNKLIKFVKVTYSVDEQKDLVRKAMEEGCEVLEQVLVNISGKNERDEIVSTVAKYLARLRIDLALSFKHPAFNNEKEWRVVVEKWSNGIINHDGFKDIHYRSAKGAVVPFLKLDFSSKNDKDTDGQKLLPLRQIFIGPKHKIRQQQEQAKKSLEMQLRSKGYKELDNSLPPIHVSEIPYQ